MKRSPLLLPGLARFGDLALLTLRLLTGAFLIDGVWDNITSGARMEEFVGFLAASNFPSPELLAPLSVYAQLIAGALLALGLFTRWAGLVIAFNFIVAVVGVHWEQSFREWWPAIVLVGIGLVHATIGPGRIALDSMFGREQRR